MTEDIHAHRILIVDFGSQYTQLIARRVREAGVYCEIWPYDHCEHMRYRHKCLQCRQNTRRVLKPKVPTDRQ